MTKKLTASQRTMQATLMTWAACQGVSVKAALTFTQHHQDWITAVATALAQRPALTAADVVALKPGAPTRVQASPATAAPSTPTARRPSIEPLSGTPVGNRALRT